MATPDCLVGRNESSGVRPSVALWAICRLGSGTRSGVGDRLQSCLEPRRKFFVSDFSTGHSRHDVCQHQIVHRQPIPASDNQQFHQVDGRPLVAVHKAVIGDDGVDQSGRLLVDTRVVAVVGPDDRGLDGRAVEDS